MIFIFSQHYIFSQKHDYNWMIGYKSRDIPEGEGILFNFNKNPLDIKFVNKKMYMYLAGNTYSNEKGDLYVYSNGCEIHNSRDSLILNGDSLNSGGIIFRDFCNDDDGYPVVQSTIFLPNPNKLKADSTFFFCIKKLIT